jgi:hypothetical protein
VAVIDSARSITLEEVDKAIARQLQSLEERIYLLRRTALESIISRAVLETAARREGVTVEQFTRTLMSAEPRISEQRIAEIFSENESAPSRLWERTRQRRRSGLISKPGQTGGIARGHCRSARESSGQICLDEPVTASSRDQ